MLGAPIKKLIIVTGEKEIVYAELLSSLISLKDDDTENNEVVGIRDGSVEAVVWTEDIYNNNRSQLGSNTKIIFIGKTKAADAVIPSIRYNKELEKYGVYEGWISNKAAIYITEKQLRRDKTLYDEFFASYIQLSDKFDDSISDTESMQKIKHTDEIDVAFKKGIQNVSGIFGAIKSRINNEKNVKDVSLVGTDLFDIGAKMETSKELPDQMFRFAVLNFYLNGLADFMEIK